MYLMRLSVPRAKRAFGGPFCREFASSFGFVGRPKFFPF